MIQTLIAAIFISWLITRLIKTIIDWVKEKKPSLKVLFADGGMPSAHTALIVSTATAIYLEAGFSMLFVLSVVVALIVMNDALKVRMVTQEQSIMLNQMRKDAQGLGKSYKKLNQRVGHKPLEVAVGLLIGVIIPVVVYSL